MSINWKRKLSSRKFWAAVAAVAIAISPLEWKETVVSVLGLIAYMFSEGMTDAANKEEKEN